MHKKEKKSALGAKVSFAEPDSPGVDRMMMDQDDERGDLIKKLDRTLSGIDVDINDDEFGKSISLGELSKSKSRMERDMIE